LVRDTVEFIRRGKIQCSTHWSVIPNFGWPEWPDRPYLWVSITERQNRFSNSGAPSATDNDRMLALPLLYRYDQAKSEKPIEIYSLKVFLPKN